MSGETPDLSGGIGGGVGPGGGSAASGVGAGGTGAGGFGGIAGSQIAPILIAGGLSGVIAMGALIAFNIVPVHSSGSGASPRGLVLVACPDSGPVLAVVDPGQKLLVTGRSGDGAWLQVYLPGPALPYAWAPASELQPSGDTGTLPVAGCEVAAASPSGTPIVAVVSPTPTPTPTPTATPTNSSPVIADLVASPGTIYYPWADSANKCGPDAKDPDTTTISATISDPQGVLSATLFFRLPTGSYASKAMTHSGSTYAATVKVPKSFDHTGNLDYYVVSKDGSVAGKTRTSPLKAVSVKKCDLPPTVMDSNAPFGNGVMYLPLESGGGPCPPSNSLSIVASASDPDGTIAKIVFYFTPRGSNKPLSLTLLKQTQSSSLFTGTLTNAKFPKLAKKGNWNLPWYMVAFDNAGRGSAKYTTSPLQERSC